MERKKRAVPSSDSGGGGERGAVFQEGRDVGVGVGAGGARGVVGSGPGGVAVAGGGRRSGLSLALRVVASKSFLMVLALVFARWFLNSRRQR